MAGTGIKLESGHVLDERYHLERVIGEGGMGTVFAARHLELGETVAIKVLQSPANNASLDEEHLERFLREARLAAKIKNEHVVRVLDVARGKDGAPPYIVMELLDGSDISDLVRAQGRVAIPDAVGYMLQACEALAEAHALGIVHRDLKSSNLHVSRRADGSPLVKVLDFGISKMHDDDEGDSKLTTTAAVFGSPAYMSPEQIRSAKHVDYRTDIWALGVVLYEMITAELPFLGDNASAMLAAISADPSLPLSRYIPNAPPGLEYAIANALTKDREKRTQTIAAFAETLAPFALSSATSSLIAIRHIAARPRSVEASSSRSHGSMRPPPAPSFAPPMSDTMRASSPQNAGVFAIAPLPFSPLETPRHAAVSRTDRDVMTTQQRMSPLLLAIITGVVVAGLASIGFALFILKTRTVVPPPDPHIVSATSVPDPTPTPVLTSIELPSTDSQPSAVSSSAITPPHGSSSAGHPHARVPRPASSQPTPKPNGTIDTSQRE